MATNPEHSDEAQLPVQRGSFSGNPKTEWLEEIGSDRTMQLLEDFWFIDPDGRKWEAKKGAVVNGASIPSPLWSTIGSPYTGEYRRASIVHDIACDDPTVDRKQADKMFYFACLAGGCTKFDAQLLYAGVRIGAWFPSVRLWTESILRPFLKSGRTDSSLTDESIQTTFHGIAADINSHTAPLPFTQLEDLVNRHLSAKAGQ